MDVQHENQGVSVPPPLELDVVSSTEPWSEYLLEDGSVLRIKLVVTGVYRMQTGEIVWRAQQIGDVKAGRVAPGKPEVMPFTAPY